MGNVYSYIELEGAKIGHERDNDNDKNYEPTQVINLRNIQSIGYNHFFAKGKNNVIFGWGRNDKGQLGLNENNTISVLIPKKIVLNNEIDNIFCGKDYTIFHTDKKK